MKYPIGIQDFQSIQELGCVYVDKTKLIFELVTSQSYVFLARPRRFGKSLLLSTLKSYFEGKKELFEGLEIEKLEKDWTKHPVFSISLASVKNDSHESLVHHLDGQFDIWEKSLNISPINSDLSFRFGNILRESYLQSGQRAVVLIDEYDNPLINSLEDPILHEKNRELLKSIYSNLKDRDQYIRFGMLTGVSRFSKMTIFSGLNNLFDITLDPRYSQLCGITESEIRSTLKEGVKSFAQSQDLDFEEALEILKKYYDGYHFSRNSVDIYNPFSLFNALAKDEIGHFWFSTATPTFLVKRLYNEEVNLKEIFSSEATSATLSSSDASHSSLVALMFQTGYLTIKDYDKEWDAYKLGIPNLEVKKGLMDELAKVFQNKKEDVLLPLIKNMVISLRTGNPDNFLEALKSYLSTIPYNITRKSSELYFENNIYIIINLLGIYCKAETVTSNGRIDIVIKTDRFIYVMELKLDGSAEEALRQIEKKGYALPFLNEGKTIFKIGINFSSQTRNLTSYLIEN